MFVDEVKIHVRGGAGGDGCCSFRREKFVPRGGPNGGDGGDGGSVWLVADPNVGTLLEYRYRPLHRAERGRHGQGSNKTGRGGGDVELRVPVGTLVHDVDRVRLLADLAEPGARFRAAEGGRGGRGNARFASSVNRAPTRTEEGVPGEERELILELKLLADVGLVGFPNAGKSTLISRLSAARPKIAEYPFTTLEPCLGVVDRGGYRSFVVADIPGLIEGAHEGAGLGHRFLRHVERCRLILHLVDPTDPEREPVPAVRAIREELAAYDSTLASKPRILVATKADAVQPGARIEALRAMAADEGADLLEISSASGAGLDELVHRIGGALDRLGPRDDDPDDEPGTTT